MGWVETIAGAHRTAREAAGVEITYVCGEQSVELRATPGQSDFAVADESGVLLSYRSRDFLILAADLVLAGQAVEPQRGDQIQETADGQVLVYEVMAPGGQQPWRYSDPHRTVMRVHTKQVT